LAGSNRAADTDSQRDALKSGAQLWAENCIMCHEVKPRSASLRRNWIPSRATCGRRRISAQRSKRQFLDSSSQEISALTKPSLFQIGTVTDPTGPGTGSH
jgi:hypothetical protein